MTAQTILPANSVTGSYQVENSARFETNTKMTMTPSGAPTNADKNTFSVWYKKSKVGAEESIIFANGSAGGINPRADNKIQFYNAGGTLRTDRMYKDVSAWYHLVVTTDTTLGTANNRLRMYTNGVEETSFTTRTNPDQNANSNLGTATEHVIGCNNGDANFFNGYMAEVVMIDGLALGPDSFGEFDSDSGIWKPIDVSGLTFGNNGFYLEFKDGSNLGDELKGTQTADWSETNLAATDQSTDTCTNNFATLNVLNSTLTNTVLSEGNLKLVGGSQSSNYTYITGTIAASSGKWYWEVKAVDNSEIDQVGVAKMDLAQFSNIATSTGLYGTAYGGKGVQMSNGNKVGNGSQGAHMGGFSANNICMVALDLDNNKITFGRNGSWSNGSGGADQAFADATAAYTDLTAGAMYVPAQCMRDSGNNNPGTMEYNFGNAPYAISSGNADADGHGNFEYAVPSGYFALCTKNLAEYG